MTFIWPVSALIIGSIEYRRVGGFLRFLALFGVLLALLVLIALPLAAGPFLTQMVRNMGLQSDSLQVSVALFDPFLVLGRSRSTHVSARDVDLSPAIVGSMELTLRDVSFVDRTWQAVDGELSNISISTNGETLRLGSIHVSGDAADASANARLSAAESESLIRAAAQRQGLRFDDVSFSNAGVRITTDGAVENARLDVRGGALVLFPGNGDGGVPLIQPAPADPWQLEEAWISDDGLNVRGTVDTTRLATDLIGLGSADSR